MAGFAWTGGHQHRTQMPALRLLQQILDLLWR